MLKKRVETIVTGATDAVTGALDARANSVTVRPDAASMKRIDELVEAELFANRSDATAFLVAEGIEANSQMFDEIYDGFEKIRQVKEQLRGLAAGATPEAGDEAPE